MLVELVLEKLADLLAAELLCKATKGVLESVKGLGKIGFCTDRSLVVLDLVLIPGFLELSLDRFACCFQTGSHGLLEDMHEFSLEIFGPNIQMAFR